MAFSSLFASRLFSCSLLLPSFRTMILSMFLCDVPPTFPFLLVSYVMFYDTQLFFVCALDKWLGSILAGKGYYYLSGRHSIDLVVRD
ncbi:hypothetical protein CYLTODRAFT_115399 [Cylindrobasidium torrendii FP15055 ss-10]|uniref:Uncharacterized protein n=1 Tax=Cylindrobasidium torrendii FP15055 ss-10 TaxID=1314674 RepID=A0A0D7B0K7_9AGAR|nr:hypothetical protein CYLTODRAFT_115399 [Cylindrobasidium torrendii FP15055 ss-10]